MLKPPAVDPTAAKIPIACRISALNAQQQDRRTKIVEKLLKAVDEVNELDNGYVFRYSLEALSWMEIAEFVDLERRCCPFFAFQLELNPTENKVWLHLTGEKGTKEFLKTHEDFAV